MVDFEGYERTVEMGLILGIAEALRAEFGISIDAHPGGPSNEAGVVNRAFRATARRILKTIVPKSEHLEGVVTWALRRAAVLRLGKVGVVGDRAAAILDQEAGLGDAWLTYVALASEELIRDLMGQSPGSE